MCDEVYLSFYGMKIMKSSVITTEILDVTIPNYPCVHNLYPVSRPVNKIFIYMC
jgi:hypothetical protein